MQANDVFFMIVYRNFLCTPLSGWGPFSRKAISRLGLYFLAVLRTAALQLSEECPQNKGGYWWHGPQQLIVDGYSIPLGCSDFSHLCKLRSKVVKDA